MNETPTTGGLFMIVGVPREIYSGERRVTLVPAAVPILTKEGMEAVIEPGASAGYPDAEYIAKGARVVPDRAEVFRIADVIVQVLCYGAIKP
jgi:alanine dehydrogenase